MSRFQSELSYLGNKTQNIFEPKKPSLIKTPSQQTLKVCTPIRSRMVPTQELNSTPICANRRQGERIPSPLIGRLNKENQPQHNHQPGFSYNQQQQQSPNKFVGKNKPVFMEQSRGGGDTQQLTGLQPSSRAKSPLMKDKSMGGIPTNTQVYSQTSPFSKMSEGLKNYMQFGALPGGQQSLTPSSSKMNIGKVSVGASNLPEYLSLNTNNEADLKSSNSFRFLGTKKTSQASLLTTPGTNKGGASTNMFTTALISNIQTASPTNTFGSYLKGPLQQNKQIIEDKKLKNEVIDDIIKNCGKKQQEQQQVLRNSNSLQTGFLNFNNQSRLNTADITSKKISNHLSPSAVKEEDLTQIMCLNNHGKKAKYRVVNENPDEDDDNMYYCASCSVMLVQQGFRTQPIEVGPCQDYFSKATGNRDFCAGSLNFRITELSNKLATKKEKLQKIKETHCQKYQKDLDQIDSYYNSLISTIQQMRVKDRQTVISDRDESLSQIDHDLSRLGSTYTRLAEFIQTASNPDKETEQLEAEINDLSAYLDFAEEAKPKLIAVEDNVQEKFDSFVNALYQDYSLKISFVESSYRRIPSGTSGNNSVYFSFEKTKQQSQIVANDKKPPNNDRITQPFIQEESVEQEDRNQSDESMQINRKPFRNLFPDQSEEQRNPQQLENAESGQDCETQQNRPNKQIVAQQQIEDRHKEQEKYDCYSPSFRNI